MRGMKERFKVRSAEVSKCASCTHFRQARGNDDEIFARRCESMPGAVIPELVTECFAYDYAYDDAPYHMERAAWDPILDANRRVLTFRHPTTQMARRRGTWWQEHQEDLQVGGAICLAIILLITLSLGIARMLFR